MSYVAWSVVFGEQPSAAKWNILGANDASFNDGTGIGTNAIAAASLATNALLLNYTTKTSNQSVSSASSVQVTGLSATVTIPSGGRSVKITAYCPVFSNGATAQSGWEIWDGTVGSGTRLQAADFIHSASISLFTALAVAVVTPSAGSKTYNVGARTSSGTATVNASSTSPTFLLVELV